MPSSILRPDSDLGWLRGDALDLERKLQQGDGMGLPGDPNLTLAQGVITALKRTQHPITGRWLNKGDIIQRRWEVWRKCEDGVDRLIGHWRMEEFDRIILDLSKLRVDSPGHVASTELADSANAALEAKQDAEVDALIQDATEYATKLHHDLTEPKNVFRQMPGLRDEPKAPSAE